MLFIYAVIGKIKYNKLLNNLKPQSHNKYLMYIKKEK